jgi:uncharacterized SAM-binding protein YcdF (DUF218 family)
MGLILSKYLPVFLLPLGLSVMLLAAGLVCLWKPVNRRKTALLLILICLLTLWSTGSHPVADCLISSLEAGYVSREAAAYPEAATIVVLGGGVTGQRTGGRNILPSRAFDRLYLGCRLYQSGKAPVMVLSGGGIAWRQGPGSLPESRQMSVLARELGVPDQAMILESHSRNTRENAWFTREILREKGRTGPVMLVTSAFHMPRARACFEKLGMTVIPCPADFRSDAFKKRSALDFLPDAGALEDATIVLREYTGMLYYRLRGWI